MSTLNTQNTQRRMIAQTVASIEAADALEGDHQGTVLDWIASGDELYRLVPPDQPPRHLVSYFVPFDPARGRVLLTEHRKSGLMLPPGGHCEPGELPWQTVRRECMEELAVPAVALTQLGPEPLFVTVTETRPTVQRHTDVSLWYVIELDHADERLRPDPREFDGVRWYSLDELLGEPIEEFDPHTHRFVRKLNKVVSDV